MTKRYFAGRSTAAKIIRGCLLLATLTVAAATAAAQARSYDLLIINGRVLDGTGNVDFRADVGITGDRIAAIGNLRGATSDRVIDAAGLYVAPGFIDLHSHADRGIEHAPR